jgi:hypothetical protein
MSDEARKALEMMGLSVDEMLEEDVIKRPKYTDSRICLCGHAVARHTATNGFVYCKPSKMECPCKNVRPVLETDDTRKFLRKTEGGGKLHALSLGMLQILRLGKSVKWIVDLKCDRCGSEDDQVVPVPVTQTGRPTNYATGYDALLCRACRTEI